MSKTGTKRKSPGTFPFDVDTSGGALNQNEEMHSSKKKKRRDISTYVENATSSPQNTRKHSRSRAAMPSNAYDEADGDFVFTRGPRKAKRSSNAVITGGTGDESQTSSRNPKKNEATRTSVSPAKAASKPLRSKRTSSSSVAASARHSVRRSPRLQHPGDVSSTLSRVTNSTTIKVSLAAVEDTPIVRKRNKEMREGLNGQRRSSIGLRGRRTSSLSNGCVAAPHPDVDHAQFYKHLQTDSTEPLRMRYLLAWCGKRAFPDGGLKDSDVKKAARVVSENISRDLTEQKVTVDWWSRPADKERQMDVTRKPNPKNFHHLEKIQRLQEELQRLNHEKGQWAALKTRNPARIDGQMQITMSAFQIENIKPLQALPISGQNTAFNTSIRNTLGQTQKTLEFNVDASLHGLHKEQQHDKSSRSTAEKILAATATLLNRQQELDKRESGTANLPMQEVLVALSHQITG